MNVKKRIKTVQNLSRKNFTVLMFIKEMHTCTSTVILGVLKNEKESWQRDGEEPLGREMVLWRTPRLREPGWGGELEGRRGRRSWGEGRNDRDETEGWQG